MSSKRSIRASLCLLDGAEFPGIGPTGRTQSNYCALDRFVRLPPPPSEWFSSTVESSRHQEYRSRVWPVPAGLRPCTSHGHLLQLYTPLGSQLTPLFAWPRTCPASSDHVRLHVARCPLPSGRFKPSAAVAVKVMIKGLSADEFARRDALSYSHGYVRRPRLDIPGRLSTPEGP